MGSKIYDADTHRMLLFTISYIVWQAELLLDFASVGDIFAFYHSYIHCKSALWTVLDFFSVNLMRIIMCYSKHLLSVRTFCSLLLVWLCSHCWFINTNFIDFTFLSSKYHRERLGILEVREKMEKEALQWVHRFGCFIFHAFSVIRCTMSLHMSVFLLHTVLPFNIW